VAEDERRPSIVSDGLVALGQRPDAMFILSTPVVYRYADPVRGDVRRPLAVVPAVSVTLDRSIEYAPANQPLDRVVRVTLRPGSGLERDVRVSLELPQGLAADSAARDVHLPAACPLSTQCPVRAVGFRIRGRLPVGRHTIRAVAESNGERFTIGYEPIEYEHIRPQKLYREATLAIEAVDVKLPAGLTIAYLPGVGDNVAPTLQQLGLDVTVVDPATIARVDLSRFSTVVVGPRAYESSPELVANNAKLLDYVERGGTLVVQYGQYEMTRAGMMPYSIDLARPADRVTDENAPVKLLDPSAPALATPNRIGAQDFAGWVQERALYMPRAFDDHYRPLLQMSDPGEPPNSGAILVAR
jgi:hypothetical protein